RVAHRRSRLRARRRADRLRGRAPVDLLHLQRLDGRDLHHEGADHRHHGRRRRRARCSACGPDPRHRRDRGGEPDRPRLDARSHLHAVHRRAAVPPAGHLREASRMTTPPFGLAPREVRIGAAGAAAVVLAALLPLFDQAYYLSLSVNIMLYAALCTAWTLFSGPTHYVSLATAAFFGLGTYSVALFIDHLPFPLLVGLGALVAATLAGLV